MTRNQLPEGVGKKIVEALKRQAEADITPVINEENSISDSVPLTEVQNLQETPVENLNNDNIIIEEEPVNLPEGVYQEKEEELTQVNQINIQEQNIMQETGINQTLYSTTSVALPPNVATLKNLIATLPTGVTKQTGAQIIKQTFEAMGLPMTTVLKEAQGVQDELKSSTKECMLKIQEYKTQILQLESSVQEYQKSISQINDLISLFLLTDNK